MPDTKFIRASICMDKARLGMAKEEASVLLMMAGSDWSALTPLQWLGIELLVQSGELMREADDDA